MFIEKIKIPIVPEIMRIDTRTQAIDMQQIDNRRFMYNPDTGLLVLGRQYAVTSLMDSSHAGELAAAGVTKDYDTFVRGWVGAGGDYPVGVVHFAPSVDARNVNITSADEPERKPSVRQRMKETKPAEPDRKQKPAKQQER